MNTRDRKWVQYYYASCPGWCDNWVPVSNGHAHKWLVMGQDASCHVRLYHLTLIYSRAFIYHHAAPSYLRHVHLSSFFEQSAQTAQYDHQPRARGTAETGSGVNGAFMVASTTPCLEPPLSIVLDLVISPGLSAEKSPQ